MPSAGPSLSATVSLTTLSKTAAILAVVKAFDALIDITAQFGEQMSKVAAVSQATGSELEQLTTRARELGRDTQFTATEAGQGMEELARLGLTIAENYEAIGSTLNLAAAAALGLGRASEITAGSLRAFGLSADQAGRVTDILAITAANSGANVDNLGEALAQAGSIAKTANVSIGEFNAFLGALGDRLIRGSAAGTGFRQFIIGLSTETKKGAVALKELGLTYKDVDIANRGLVPVLETLSEAMAKIEDPTQRVAIAAEIWGRRQFNSALVALDSVDKIKSLGEAYDAGAGAAQRMANVMVDNLAGSFKLFKSATQEVALSIGAELTPNLRDLLDDLTAIARASSESGTALSNVGKVLGTVLSGFNILIKAITAIPAAIQLVFNKILVVILDFVASAEEAFAKFLDAVGLRDAAQGYREQADFLRDVIANSRNQIKEEGEKLGEVALAISDDWDLIVKTWSDAPEKLSDVDVSGIDAGIERALRAVKASLAAGREDVEKEVAAIRAALNLSKILENRQYRIDTGLQRDLAAYFRSLKEVARKGGEELSPEVARVVELVSSFGKGATISPETREQLAGYLDAMISKLEESGGKVSNNIIKLRNSLEGFGAFKLSDETKNQLKVYLDLLIALIEKAGQDVPKNVADFRRALDEVPVAVGTAAAGVSDAASDLGDSIDEVVATLEGGKGAISATAKEVQAVLKDIFGQESFDEIQKQAAALKGAIQSIGGLDAVKFKLSDEQKAALKEELQKIVDAFRDNGEQIDSLLADTANNIGITVGAIEYANQQAAQGAVSIAASFDGASTSISNVGAVADGAKTSFDGLSVSAADLAGKGTEVVISYDAQGNEITRIVQISKDAAQAQAEFIAKQKEAAQSASEAAAKQKDASDQSKESIGEQVAAVDEATNSYEMNATRMAEASERFSERVKEMFGVAASEMLVVVEKGNQVAGKLDELAGKSIDLNTAGAQAKLDDLDRRVQELLEKLATISSYADPASAGESFSGGGAGGGF
jgi:TP901 family phage tail tape measure protein